MTGDIGPDLDRFDRWEPRIPGNLERLDRFALTCLGTAQRDASLAGDILEIGAYKGKSAALLGTMLGPGERLVICDLFGRAPGDDANRAELDQYYGLLDRTEFETNFRDFHGWLPVIHQCSSLDLESRLASDERFRFIHVDGSHLDKVVRADIVTARNRLADGGIVVFDDFRAPHAPGVAAAVWAAVETQGLVPIAITDSKLYGGWGPLDPAIVDRLTTRAGNHGIGVETIALGSGQIVRLFAPPQPRWKQVAGRVGAIARR